MLPTARRNRRPAWLPWATVCLGMALVELRAAHAAEPVSFNRDIRPILADKCWRCHGPDSAARQAELRLDLSEQATAPREHGPAIVPGDAAASQVLQRVTSADPGRRMPPPREPLQLSEQEIELLRQWVAAGAIYEPHWSLIPPARPALPGVANAAWVRNPIDAFVLAELERRGWAPAPQADRATLLRRVALDLTGLPPTPKETEQFLSDESPDAYEALVERLLASPHYGERQAMVWLDAARYADSGGYQGDIFRTMWPWRDWVIEAYNRNLPFDEFSRVQLAGDLLPQASREQRLATGFHRNHRINDEEGIILEEFRVEYVADRTETTAAIWLGLTLTCARCHDHKYDPVSQREYYGLFAYFNSIDELGKGNANAPPLLYLPTAEQQAQLDALEAQLAVARAAPAVAPPADDAATDPPAAAAPTDVAALEQQLAQLRAGLLNVMVMAELPTPRPTYVLFRGAYDQPRESVAPSVPQALPPLPEGASPNRLALADWLFSANHPLTARVAVNRVWQSLFGEGLVRTPEDFGTRGEPPTHPRLLDWLAVEFRDALQWDHRALVRLIVTSATYRQAGRVAREAFLRDPENRLLGRMSRVRLPAELVRDQALAAAGSLTRQLGGPPVFPYQPAGLWAELASNHLEYPQSHGADLYRRSLYTFIRRTAPPPSLVAFDLPNRETCSVRRPRTNTPLQALAVMNDPTYVEAARKLGERALLQPAAEPAARIDYLYRCLLCRSATAAELEVLLPTLEEFRTRYRARPQDAQQMLQTGEAPAAAELDPAELAAYAAVAGILLNLDETLVRP